MAARIRSTQAKSLRGLDFFVFFIADLQTAFGPFVSVYLTSQKWNQSDIGMILAIGSIAGVALQIPGGWLVDAIQRKKLLAAVGALAVGSSAVALVLLPTFEMVAVAKLLQVAASAVIGPVIAAISLGLVGHERVGERFGRNARFASLGSGIAAAVMGICGLVLPPQSVFIVAFALSIPAIWAAQQVNESDIDRAEADGGVYGRKILDDDTFNIFSSSSMYSLLGCLFLFHLANTSMLPLVASSVTLSQGGLATTIIALCIIMPQIVVALISPAIGRLAELWGRRPLLLVGFGALVLRGCLIATSAKPYYIVAFQLLDGISGAVLGVIVPLCSSDITRGTSHFNLALGVIGCATGVGAALSSSAAGYLADGVGTPATQTCLAATALIAFLVLLSTMPETKGMTND